MPKFKNIAGEDVISGPLQRHVLDGEVVEVSDDLAKKFKWAAPFWEPVKEPKAKVAGGNDESQEG